MTDTKNTVSEEQKAIATAIFDPGAVVGMKGDRTLTEWQVDAVTVALQSLRASSSSEERRRRAAGPSEVKWPMPDPLAKYKDAALRASIPGGVGVKGISVPNAKWSDREPIYEAAIAAYEANTPKDYRYSAIALVKAVDAAIAHIEAAPSNPVISDEMVERVSAQVEHVRLGIACRAPDVKAATIELLNQISSLTAALSVKPQSGSDKP